MQLQLDAVEHEETDIARTCRVPEDLQLRFILGLKAAAKEEGHIKAAALELNVRGTYANRDAMEANRAWITCAPRL